MNSKDGMVSPRAARAWVNSDTWYAFREAEGYVNARTGMATAVAPTGLRPDGQRRLSAASTGPWAVPFASPPLRSFLAPSASVQPDLLAPCVEGWGSCTGPTFSAPHGVNLARDGLPEHLPEDFTTYLARVWAAHTGGRSVTWGSAAVDWCTAFKMPLQSGKRLLNY